MLTRENCIAYATDFVRKIRNKGIDIKVAKIFGSYSRDNANELSDIDLLLVSDKFDGVGFIDFKLFSQELVDYDKIQVRTYSIKDYEEGDPFLVEIEKDAITIH